MYKTIYPKEAIPFMITTERWPKINEIKNENATITVRQNKIDERTLVYGKNRHHYSAYMQQPDETAAAIHRCATELGAFHIGEQLIKQLQK